jgi:spore germination cell wall hydrolase CwlJ-like protein
LKDGLQPSEVRTKYQYAGWHETPSESVKEAVYAVFDKGNKIVDEPILYFYAPKYCEGEWHETQSFVIEVGGHRFFKEHKEWGG